jgi:hypothetical protein
MTKRKKRATRSIKSLELQIAKHEEKRAEAGIPELRGYYDKEIKQLKAELAKKKEISRR